MFANSTLNSSYHHFTWFTYWLARGLGVYANRETGAIPAFDEVLMQANIEQIDEYFVTLSEAYRYVKHMIDDETTPMVRQTVCVWPANDPVIIQSTWE